MLITLAIIGVVAVLTIPTLVANYQQRGWNTSATVFERKLEESLKIMNTQGTLAGYKTTESFVNELQKHLKITRVCKNDDLLSCFEDTVMWGGGEAEPEEVEISTIKASKNFGQDDWGTNIVGLQLANGTSALIAYNPNCKQDPYSNQITGTSCVAILYDTSGYSKPNTSGKDLRSINVSKLGKSCAFELGGLCYGVPFKPAPLTIAECEAKKAEFKIPVCEEVDNNYWAGAIVACGGANNIPTRQQLASIANYIYNTNSVKYNGDGFDLTMDNDKASSLGFKASNAYFNLWSRDRDVESFAVSFTREFYNDSTLWSARPHTDSSALAICIGN